MHNVPCLLQVQNSEWHHLGDHVAKELEYYLAGPLRANANIKED